MKLRPLLFACVFAATVPAGADEGANSACRDPASREFDFWLGDWDVGDEQGRVGGRNTITSELDGCVIVERYLSGQGNAGFSVNWFDPRERTWTQQWFGLGILLRMTGRMEGGQMVLEGPLLYLKEGRTTTLKGIWTLLPDGRVRQQFLESDDGENWSVWFDGYYSRRSLALK